MKREENKWEGVEDEDFVEKEKQLKMATWYLWHRVFWSSVGSALANAAGLFVRGIRLVAVGLLDVVNSVKRHLRDFKIEAILSFEL